MVTMKLNLMISTSKIKLNLKIKKKDLQLNVNQNNRFTKIKNLSNKCDFIQKKKLIKNL